MNDFQMTIAHSFPLVHLERMLRSIGFKVRAHNSVTPISDLSNMTLAYHESNIVTYSACLFTEKSGPTKFPLAAV